MSRLTDILLGFCFIATVGLMVSGLIYLGGFPVVHAWFGGFQIFCVMVFLQFWFGRRAQMRRLDELASFAELVSRDLEIVETQLEKVRQPPDPAAVQPGKMDRKLEVLQTDIRQLQTALACIVEPGLSGRRGTGLPVPDKNPVSVLHAEKHEEPGSVTPDGAGHIIHENDSPENFLQGSEVAWSPCEDTSLDIIRRSIEKNRIDLYLQPVVMLPQRRTRFYEGLSRIRGDDGEVIMPADYMRVAEPAGMMPAVDSLILLRCVKIMRELALRNSEVGFFCNISRYSLLDNHFFEQFIEYMTSNQKLSSRLIFEFSQETVEACGPIELASLKALSGMGFSFSMDRVTSLRVDFRQLRDLGFRYMKVPASVLLNAREEHTDIHPEDIHAVMKRHGMTLIVDRIEDENTVVNILDYNIDYGQGFLFGEPRPVDKSVLAA